MKIKIRTEDCKMTLRFPTSLLLGRMTFSIAMNRAKEYIEFDNEQKDKLIKLLKRTRKKYKGLKLVEVKTAAGEIIEITL